MTPALNIALGVLFLIAGGFVVVQGLRARKSRTGPWPKFFLFAFVVHFTIALLGVFLIATGLFTLGEP